MTETTAVYPVPEAVDEKPDRTWNIKSSEYTGARVYVKHSLLRVPLDGSQQSRMTRNHELGHIRWSPAESGDCGTKKQARHGCAPSRRRHAGQYQACRSRRGHDKRLLQPVGRESDPGRPAHTGRPAEPHPHHGCRSRTRGQRGTDPGEIQATTSRRQGGRDRRHGPQDHVGQRPSEVQGHHPDREVAAGAPRRRRSDEPRPHSEEAAPLSGRTGTPGDSLENARRLRHREPCDEQGAVGQDAGGNTAPASQG